jgi:hypothetical protein
MKMTMSEFVQNIFYAFVAEVFVVLTAWLVKEDKRRQVIVLVFGTSIAGANGFGPIIFHSLSTVPETQFTGIWQGTDPSDGSITTIALTQKGNVLTGRYNDSYSGNVNPPGWHGEGLGTIISPTTAHIVFNLSRWDENTGNWDVQLTISTGNNTIMINNCIWKNETDTAGCPMVLERQ